MADLAIGLVGCGRLAEVGYLPAFRATPGVRLVAVADPDARRRTDVASAASDGHRVTTFADGATLLAEAEVDAVVLATPAPVHLADARAAAATGVHVLVEKPPAPDGDGAARLAALRPAPWVAFNRRFGPEVAAVRAAVPSGTPVRLDLALHYRRRSWSAHAVADDALLDLGPHLVDLARWVTGGEVTAVAAATVAHDRTELALELTTGTARLSCATDRPHRERIDVRDDAGRRLARSATGGPVAGVLARLPGRRGPHPLVASLTDQLGAFGTVVRGGTDPRLGTADDGLAVMRVIDAARVAARERRAVTLDTSTHAPEA